jgi:hypothetical protein
MEEDSKAEVASVTVKRSTRERSSKVRIAAH